MAGDRKFYLSSQGTDDGWETRGPPQWHKNESEIITNSAPYIISRTVRSGKQSQINDKFTTVISRRRRRHFFRVPHFRNYSHAAC